MQNEMNNQTDLQVPEGFVLRENTVGFNSRFGAVYQSIDDRNPAVAFRVSDFHLNGRNICHGGALMTFADVVMADAARRLLGLEQHRATPTQTLNIDFLRPAFAGDWLKSRSELVKGGGRTLVLQTVITCGDRNIARANATFVLLESTKNTTA